LVVVWLQLRPLLKIYGHGVVAICGCVVVAAIVVVWLWLQLWWCGCGCDCGSVVVAAIVVVWLWLRLWLRCDSGLGQRCLHYPSSSIKPPRH